MKHLILLTHSRESPVIHK